MSNPKPEPYTEREWREGKDTAFEHPARTHIVRTQATVDHLFARVAELEGILASLADHSLSALRDLNGGDDRPHSGSVARGYDNSHAVRDAYNSVWSAASRLRVWVAELSDQRDELAQQVAELSIRLGQAKGPDRA